MSDIDTYLTQLRAHLTDIHPKRADEIVAEARTHIEARAAQLCASGMSEEEASSEATRTFGDPSQVAQDLIQGNTRYRRPTALRAVGALVIAFGSILILSFVVGAVFALSRAGTFTLPAALDPERTTRIVNWAGYCCIALLTGIVGGRRFWWIAALPAIVSLAFSLVVRFFLLPPGVELSTSPLNTLVLGAAFTAMMASLGWLGSRLPRRRRLSTAITIVSGSVVGLVWVGLVVFAVAASIKAEDTGAWYFGVVIATVMPVIVALLIAGRRDRFLSREAFIASLSGLCGLNLAFAVVLAVWSESHSALRYTWRPLTIAGLVCVVGLLGALTYWRRTQPEPTPGQRHLPPV